MTGNPKLQTIITQSPTVYRVATVLFYAPPRCIACGLPAVDAALVGCGWAIHASCGGTA